MYCKLLASTALAALAVPLSAETVVDTKRTTPVRTSQLKNGVGDTVKISKDGSVELTTGPAIVVDTDHSATNEGKLVVTNADGASGIELLGNRSANITNSGTITVDETYAPTDIDNDKDLDGPYAVGRDRAAIRVRGNLTGNISHSGTIVVEGNQSAGILVNGSLAGKLVHDGKTSVIGDSAVGVSVRDVTGDVRLAGSVTAVGSGAVGASFGGNIGGALVVQGEIGATGYRYVAVPADATKLDADDLLQGGSALVVEGNVAKGIHFAVAPKDTNKDDPDEDKDGFDDAKEGSAKVVSYGAAPAVVIGATNREVQIGSVPATGFGFGIVIDGEIAGHGVNSGIDGHGMVVAGRGGSVTVEKGIAVNGSLTATSKDASATALRLGRGASIPELRNSGSISATGGKTGTAKATAVLVEEGATLPLLRNSSTIKATAGGEDGGAYAVVDRSGTLKLVENSGKIVATGAKAGSGRNVALDLAAVTSGATVKQIAVGAGIDAPLIDGDILFGNGSDVLDIADGKIVGRVTFVAGQDRLAMSGDARFEGRMDFGGQGDAMALTGASVFAGQADFGGGSGTVTIADKATVIGRLTASDNIAVDLSGGTLDLTSATRIGSLKVGAAGMVVATLNKDPAAGTGIVVGGAASFEKGAKLRLRLTDIANAEGVYEVLKAGSLSGAANLTADSTLVPFMYKSALAIDQAAGAIKVNIGKKETKDLGLNKAQGTTYDRLYAALAKDKDVAGVFLGITGKEDFRAAVAQTLPDHAGAAFDGISLGMRNFARSLAMPSGPIEPHGKLRFATEFAGWDSTKGESDSAKYDLGGLGFSGGVELNTGLGSFGVTGTWLWNKHVTAAENSVMSNTYEAAAYWRGSWGAFSGFARGSYGFSDFSGSRHFAGMNVDKKVERTVDGKWSGNVASFIGGISLEAGSQFFFFRPSISVDYISLSEDGYTETGGGKSLDLTVKNRDSDEFAVNLATAAGVDLLGMSGRDRNWLRVEAEGGWREILSGQLGPTTAQFAGGQDFTLLADQRSNGWFARLRGLGGDEYYTLSGEVSAEQRNDKVGYGLRASLKFEF